MRGIYHLLPRLKQVLWGWFTPFLVGLVSTPRQYISLCHGPSLDDDKAPAMGHGSSLDDKTPITTPAATAIAKLPTVVIGKHDLSFESHSIQDLNALADVELLWDVRG